MTVTFDAVSSAQLGNTTGTTLSWTHTPTGTPSAVAVGLHWYPTGAGVPSSVTYGGVAMVLEKTVTQAPEVCQLWGLVNPPSGPQTVTVTFPTSGGAYIEAGAVSVTGSDTATCFSASNSAVGSGTSPSVTVSGTTNGDLLVDVCGTGGVTPGPSVTTQTSRWNENATSSSQYAAGSTDPISGSSITTTWTAPAGAGWLIAAGAFKVAGGGGGASVTDDVAVRAGSFEAIFV